MLKKFTLPILTVALLTGLTVAPVSPANAIDSNAVAEAQSAVKLEGETFAAALIVVGMDSIDTVRITDKADTLGGALEARGYRLDSFLTEAGKPLTKGKKFADLETVIVYESGLQGASKSISIPFGTTEKPDSTLYKGQKVQEKKGVNGTAIQTVIKTRSLAADGSVNSKSAEVDGIGLTEESQLVVASPPVSAIVRVGTKECDSEYVCELAAKDMFTELIGGMAFPLGHAADWGTYTGTPSHEHGAIDMPTPQGSPIYSVAPGTVEFADWEPGGGGNVAVISHADGNSTAYAHMVEKPIVKVGEKVKAGQLIGFVGSTGNSSGPHLHFEVRKNTTKWGVWIPAYSYLIANGLNPGNCTSGADCKLASR